MAEVPKQEVPQSSNEEETKLNNKKQDEVLPLLPLFRSNSLKRDEILLQSLKKSVSQPLDNVEIKPPLFKRNVSDGIAISNASLKETYKVRACRVEDSEYIFKLLHQTWPEYGDWRNTKYWTKQFLENNEIYGFVIEQIIINDLLSSSKLSQDKDKNGESKSNETEEKEEQNRTEINNNDKEIESDNKRIVGIALYQWNQPGPAENWAWRETDFPAAVQSDFNNPKYEKEEYQEIIDKEKKEQKDKVIGNINLDKHFSKFHTHFVHFTDIAIDPDFRGKGLGTQLVQTIIYSFPNHTKFGLEVECTNIGAVKCYSKCGFQITRIVQDYYDDDRDAYKMTLYSEYNQKDIQRFFEQCKLKHKQIRLRLLKDSINKLTKQKTIQKTKSLDESKDDGDKEQKDDFFIPPTLTMDNVKYNDSVDSIEIVNKYLNADDEDNEYIENVLDSLGLSAFKEDFLDYGINKSNLKDLSVDILPYVIPIEDLRIKFEKWLENFKKSTQNNHDEDDNKTGININMTTTGNMTTNDQ